MMVAIPKNIGHDCHMESTSKHNPPLLMESIPKHDPALGLVYERFLELPVPIVLAVMWLAGAALIGFCGLALYYSLYFFWLSLPAVAGGKSF
jgi:hypothetical protein